MKVNIHTILQYEQKKEESFVSGIWNQEDRILSFYDSNKNRMRIELNHFKMERETKEYLFQYTFVEEGSIFIKEKKTNLATKLPLHMKKYLEKENEILIEYQIEGNQDAHLYQLEWEMKK